MNKPYEGLKPGTPAWMRCWREFPSLQDEMLRYAKTRQASPQKRKPKLRQPSLFEEGKR